jgi:hypothetical protein
MGGINIFISGYYGGQDSTRTREAVLAWKQKIPPIVDALNGEGLALIFQLFVSGEITTYPGPSGYSNIRLQLKSNKVTCQITMQPEIWQQGDSATIDFLKSTLIAAVNEISEKLAKKGLTLDASRVKQVIEQNH